MQECPMLHSFKTVIMKKIAIICLSALVVATSCEQKETKVTTDTGTETSGNAGNKDNAEAPKPIVSDAMCFAQQNARDTFRLNLKKDGNNATGSLVYLFKEKDSNRGQISGTMMGDTLIADYTFNAEGTSSTREVAFLIQGDKATEGYGDMEEKNGKMVFKDRSKLSFGKGIVMSKVDCQ